METKESSPHDADSYGAGAQGVEMTPPPSVSLSLRIRESCALAVKRIFDQMNANVKNEPNLTTDGSGTGLHDAKAQVSPAVWRTKEDGLETTNVGHLISSLRSNPSSSPNRQHSAQLTIFYSGTVNVYNDVPADKANAIMLLAGNGSTVINAGNQGKSSVPSPNVPPVSLTSSGKQSLPSPAVVNTATNITSNSNSPLFRASLQPAVTHGQSQVVPKRSTGIELPHARKASLARFLEKRKDRVQKPTPSMASESVPMEEMSKDENPLPKRQATEKDKQCNRLQPNVQYKSADLVKEGAYLSI